MSIDEPQNAPGRSTSGRGLLAAVGLLAVVGLAASIYLSVLHWQVHNVPGHISFCAVNEEVNCDTVALSDHSVVAGVPISTWGGLFYLLVIVLSGWGWFARRPPWPFALLGALFAAATGATVFLYLVSALVIHSLCIGCLTLYGVNVLAAMVCILGQRKVGLPPTASASLILGGAILGALGFLPVAPEELLDGWPLVATIGGVAFVALAGLNLKGAWRNLENWLGGLRHDLDLVFEKHQVGYGLSILAVAVVVATVIGMPHLYPAPQQEMVGGLKNISHGTTPEGHHWIGAEHPEVTIIEYSDYECPFCRQAHEVVRKVVRLNKEWLRLVHVHMPLDKSCNERMPKPFHRHACDCALAAICAAEQGAFWAMNDRLFIRRGGLDSGGLSVLAGNMGLDVGAFRACMKSDRARQTLRENLEECDRLKLKLATPTFSMGGHLIIGLKDTNWWHKTANAIRVAKYRAAQATEEKHKSSQSGGGGPDGELKGPGG